VLNLVLNLVRTNRTTFTVLLVVRHTHQPYRVQQLPA
jgi:hypothetical protein